VGAKIQMVLSSTISASGGLVPSDVGIFDIDLFETPATTIEQLHSQGAKVICYFSAGTSEEWRPDYSSFTSADKGAGLPDWQGEKYLDLRSANVLDVMKKRIQMASQNGCDAIDPDNMDGYSNGGGGFSNPLTQQDSANFVRALASEAAKYGISTGLKNAQAILASVRDVVQFAVNEECRAVTNDCNVYDDFVSPADQSVGKPVFHVEYALHSSNTEISSTYDGFQNMSSDEVKAAYCLQSNTLEAQKFSTFIKVLALDGWVLYCDGSSAVTPAASDSK